MVSRHASSPVGLLTFRGHLHIFVGQYSPSFSSTVFSQFSFHFIVFISSRVLSIHLRLSRPILLFPCTTMPLLVLDMLFSSLLLMCPYQFNLFYLRNVYTWHSLALLYDLVSDMVLCGRPPLSNAAFSSYTHYTNEMVAHCVILVQYE